MALATAQDVKAALRRDLTAGDQVDLESLLEEASDLVIGYLHPCLIPAPTPPAISRVVADMVAAVLNRPKGALPEANTMSAGPFNIGFQQGTNSPTPFLTAALKVRLQPFRCGNGMVAVQLGSERY